MTLRGWAISVLGVLVIIAAGVAIGVVVYYGGIPRPSLRPPAQADTVWMGCTWVETKDGKVIVKYERVENPVLWDSLREAK